MNGHEAEAALCVAMGLATTAKAAVVETESDYLRADQACAAIKGAAKAAEGRRIDLVKPLNDTVKKINGEFRKAAEAFEQALVYYRAPMSAYQAKQARIRAEAEAAARAEETRQRAAFQAAAEAALREANLLRQEAADPFQTFLAGQEATEKVDEAKAAYRAMAVVSVPVEAPSRTIGVSTRTYTTWTYEVVDEALIPDEFRAIDYPAIDRAVRTGKEKIRIPGLRIFPITEVK